MTDIDTYEPTNSAKGTHVSNLQGKIYEASAVPTTDPLQGDMWYDTDVDAIYYYNGSSWIGAVLS